MSKTVPFHTLYGKEVTVGDITGRATQTPLLDNTLPFKKIKEEAQRRVDAIDEKIAKLEREKQALLDERHQLEPFVQ